MQIISVVLVALLKRGYPPQNYSYFQVYDRIEEDSEWSSGPTSTVQLQPFQ